MKLFKSFFGLAFIAIILSFSPANSHKDRAYCEGWEEGYCQGWKDVKGYWSICPIAPICPIPKIDCYQGYKCGYNRGFRRGMRDANR